MLLVTRGSTLEWTPARFFKVATGRESSGDEFGTLEDDRCIDTGVFQHRYFLHELVFACSQPPPHQTVARCELGLFPVVNTMESGARVIW